MPNKQTEIAWAAGFYDGEGSVSCTFNNGNPYTRLQLSIGQKNDGDKIAFVLRRFQKVVGCGHIYKKTRSEKEINQHQYLIAKASDVKQVLTLLRPFLSPKKKTQAKHALQLYKTGQKQLHRKVKDESKGE